MELVIQPDDVMPQALATDKRQQFRRFVTEHRKKIYHLAYDLTGSAADAEDLSQEVFLKAYKAIDTFRENASMYTWLYRITVTTFIDLKRKKSSQAERFTDELDETRGGHQTETDGRFHLSGPERKYRREQLAQRIEGALTGLTAKERSVFTLRHQQDLGVGEIAEMMDIAPGTVKSFLFRATRKLRQSLAGEGLLSGGDPGVS